MRARWDSLALNSVLLDHVFEVILGDFSIGRRRAVQKLFSEVAKDQALLTQLTPEAVEVFNATVGDRPGVRYGCVTTRLAPRLRPKRERALRRAYRKLPGAEANDGIVPTRSQVWGRVVGAVRADHLDVIGHFGDPSTRPPRLAVQKPSFAESKRRRNSDSSEATLASK
jgi:hypothetical protein